MHEYLIECLICKKQVKFISSSLIINVNTIMEKTNFYRMTIKTKDKKINGWVCNDCFQKLGV
ncbi:MAG: hypothetical protein QW228_06025 [Candidatus Aenigmatarchaeota archaeon]